MSTAADFTTVTMRARPFALAWRAVHQAVWRDPESILVDCIAIEQYADGLLLYATDAQLLLWCWVPNDPDTPTPTPGDLIERPPSCSAFAVRDSSGIAKALMKWVVRTTKEAPGLDVKLSLRSMESDDRPTLDASLDQMGVQVLFGDEQVIVPVQEIEPPSWRSVFAENKGGKRGGKIGVGRYNLGELRRLAAVYVDEADGVSIEPTVSTKGMTILRLTYEGKPAVHGLLSVSTAADDEADR